MLIGNLFLHLQLCHTSSCNPNTPQCIPWTWARTCGKHTACIFRTLNLLIDSHSVICRRQGETYFKLRFFNSRVLAPQQQIFRRCRPGISTTYRREDPVAATASQASASHLPQFPNTLLASKEGNMALTKIPTVATPHVNARCFKRDLRFSCQGLLIGSWASISTSQQMNRRNSREPQTQCSG